MRSLFINPTKKTIHQLTIIGWEDISEVIRGLLNCDNFEITRIDDKVFYTSSDEGSLPLHGFQYGDILFLGNAIMVNADGAKITTTEITFIKLDFLQSHHRIIPELH